MSTSQQNSSLKLAINLLTEKQKSLTSYLTALGLLGNQQTLQQLEVKFTQAFNKVLADHQILKSNAEIATVSFQQIENKLELLTDNYQIEKEKYDSLTSRQLELTNLGNILTTKKQALESGFTKNQAEIKTNVDLIFQKIEAAKNKLLNETNTAVKAGIQKEINGYLIELDNTQELLAVKNSDYQKQVNLLTSQITKNFADLQSLKQEAISTQQKELATVEKRLTEAKSVYNQQQLAKANADSALQNFENIYATLFGIAPKNQNFSSIYALKFDGVDDYLESPSAIIPTQGTNHPFTVSVWAKIDPIVQAGLFELVSQGTSGNAFYIGGLGGKIRVGDTWSNTGVNVPSDGLWHLYTVVRDTNNTHLYIDGDLKASKGSAIANPANTKFWVGRQYLGGEFPKATIADISVWNTALSSTQVQTMPKDFLSGSESGLVGYWKLNEGTGNIAKDKSPFQRNLAIQGADWASDIIPKAVNFSPNYALKFDGVDDYLESPSAIIPTQGTNHPFTVSVWAKIDPIVQAGLFELVSQGTSGNAFYIGGLGGKIRVGDTWSNTGVNVPSDGLWHLYTVVRDTNNTHLYIDGDLKASKGSAIANPANTKFWVGRQYLGGEFPKATIADISVWNTALSATQVQTMPKDFLSGSESGLVGYWKLNEGTGNIAKDKSPFQRNLAIQGADWASGVIPDTVKLQQQILTLQELEVNQQRLTALQSQVVSEEFVNVALQGNNVQSYVTLIPQLGKQIQGLSDVWLKTLQDNHDLTVKVYNQQQNYSKSFDDLTKYIETKLADPDGNYAINEVQLNEAIASYDILGQRRDALARSVGDTENVISLLSAQVKQVDELNQKIQHIQYLTQYEKEYSVLQVLQQKLDEIRSFQQQLVGSNQKLQSVQQEKQTRIASVAQYNPFINSETRNLNFYFSLPFITLIAIANFKELAQAKAKEVGGNVVNISGYKALIEINLQSLNQREVDALKEIDQFKTNLNNATDNLLNSLNNPVLQDYLKSYDVSLKTKNDQTADKVQLFINQSKSLLQPKLINELSQAIDYVDVWMDQNISQETLIKTLLPNYIKQRQDAIVQTGVNDKTIADLESFRLETAYLALQSNNNPSKVQTYLQEYQATPKTEFAIKSLRYKYFPELSDVTTLATLQQQITSQLTQSQQQLETFKNTITQQQAAANAALSQANWYEEEAPIFWERSHKQGAFWTEYRTYKKKKWWGGTKTVTEEIRHVDHDWIIWDTYTKQAANFKQYAADLLKGLETNKTQQNTVTTILTQWNAAKSIADDAQLTYDQLLSQLQLLEAERQLTPEKQAQLATLEKLLPTLKTQLAQAQQEVTTAKAKVTQEWGEYQTSADTYQTALNDILKRKATLETQSQQLLQEIKEVEQWVNSQTTAIDTEIQTTTTLKQQLKTQLDAIAKKLVANSSNNDLLSQKNQLQEAIQLLTHKETILTAEKTTLTQKQTLLTAQKDVIQTEQKLLLAYLVSPDNDTSNLEKLLQDSRAALAEAQRLAQQAEASSQVLTASMEDLQTFLQLQNDKYLTAVKDKQNALKTILDATELKENYTLKAAQKQEELNTLSTQALQRLKEASDAGSQEAKTLLDVARNKNIATAAELYYKDYSDLASDKGGGCAPGLARPEDRILADHYYAEMVKYKDLEKLSQQQANQFAQIRTTAETQLEFLKQQQNLASKELADLKASIGNTQNIIDAQKQALNVAQLRVEALSELRNWTEQTLNQVLQVEKLNLAQAKIEQTIAQQRKNGIDDAITQQLERDRLSIDRQKAIATVKLEQLTQITAEDTLQQALNDLRSDLGLTPIEDFIQKAEWKADLAGILVDIEALKQKKEFSTDLKNLLNATSQDIHTALQGKEAKTIQDNLLKTTDALIKQTNSYSSAIAALQQEEQTYLTLQQKATTDLQGATKLLLAEIEKTGKLDSEKQLLTQQNLEALYKVANAKNAGEISTGLAKQSLDILNQIIDGRIQERNIRKKAFVNEVLGTATLVVAVVATVLTAGAAAAGAGLIGTTVVGGATVLGVSTATISSLASTFSLISSSLSAVQSAYNGDWAGAIFNAAMAYATFEINAINTELAQNTDVVNATKAIDVAKKADDAKLVTELTQKLENLKYTLSPNLLDLKRFQSVAQGSYNAYKYAETGDTKLALLSGIQGLANAASLGIADLKDLSKVSDAQKFFITAGQVSLVTAEGVKAIEDGKWLEAAKAISSIARTIDKNFAIGLGEAGKKELIDITGLKWEEIQDLRKLSSALYQSINNEDWIKVIQTAGKAINLVDDSLLGIDLEAESHEAIKELTGFDWAEIETIIQAGVQLGFVVKEHDLATITKSVKSIVNIWVTDDTLKAEAQKITGLSWVEIQRITNTGEAINKAIEQGNTAAWIKSSNELLGLWQGNQTLQNFLKSKINLEWKDFEQVVKAGQSVASTLNDQNAENWGQSIKQILNIWYDDATLKEKLSKVSGLSWEQIQKTEETISILNKANSQGNTLAWVEASNKFLSIWSTDKTLASKIKANTGLDWQDFEKIVKAGQTTAIAINDEDLKSWGQALRYVANIWVDDATLKSKIEKATGLTWTQLNKIEDSIQELNKATKDNNPQAWNTASDNILKIWKDDSAFATKLKEVTNLDFGDLERIVKAGQVSAIAINSNELAKWGQAIRRVVNIWVDDTTLKSTAVDLTGLSWEQLQKLDKTVQKVNTAIDKNTTQDWVTASDEILTIWKNDPTLAEKLKTYTDLDWLDIQNIVKAGQETAKAIDQKTITQWGNAIKSAVNIWVDDKTLKAQAEKATGLTWQQLENLARTNRLIAQAREEDTLETWKKSTDEILEIWSKDTVLTQKLKEKAGIEWKDVTYIVKSGQAIATAYQEQTLENLTAAIQQIVLFGNQDPKLKEKIDSLVEVEWKKIEAISQKNQKIQEGLAQQQQEIWVTTNQNLITILEASDSLIQSNVAPILIQAIPNQTVTDNKLFTFTIPENSFIDIDKGNLLTYSATDANGNALPKWLTFNAKTRTFNFNGTSTDTKSSILDIKLEAKDNKGASSSNVFRLNIIKPGVIIFDAANYSVNEDGKAITAITLTRTNGSDGAVSVTLTPSNGTATAPADFNNTPLVVSFANGETSKIVTIPIINDTIYELNETVNLTLSNPTNSATLGTQKTAVLTVIDNDLANAPKINITNPTTVIEGLDANAIFTVNLSAASPYPVTVKYTTANQTAIVGSDYTATNGTLTFAANETSKTIAVPILNDNLNETDKTFTLTLSNPTNANLSNTQIVATISDTLTASITTTLPTQVENLTLTGNDAINGTGNSLNNTITGNAANNILNGGAGNDTMIGGLGNDTYIVDSTSDVVTESSTLATEIDTVQSSVSYTLSANLEKLVLTGTAAINGTGNSISNAIAGNAANNTLNGAAGNDILSGRDGADILTGGLDPDRFVYPEFKDSLLAAPDRITDFNPSEGDRIVVNSPSSLPTALFNAGILPTASYSTLNAAAIAAYADANPNLAGTQALAIKQAVFLGWNGGTYLSVNDSTAAFNASSDLLINVTGITGTLATGSLTTNNYFSV